MKRMIDNKEYENLKQDVKDINESKLPNYVKKQEESEPYVSNIQHSGDDVVLKVEDTEGGGACVVTLENGEFNVTLGDETNNYMLGLTNTGDFTIQTKEGETIHSLTFDSEGNLKVDGNAVGGGGKQLYQHNIILDPAISITIINEVSSAYANVGQVRDALKTGRNPAFGVFWHTYQPNKTIINSISKFNYLIRFYGYDMVTEANVTFDFAMDNLGLTSDNVSPL